MVARQPHRLFRLGLASLGVAGFAWFGFPEHSVSFFLFAAAAVALLGAQLRLSALLKVTREDLASVSNQLNQADIGTALLSDKGGDSSRDVAAQVKRTISELRANAERDQLTGLLNRSHTQQEIEKGLNWQSQTAGQSALIFIDIDGFKSVNDSLGHHLGDRLLQVVADRLRLATRLDEDSSPAPKDLPPPVRKRDLVSRHGGDEFIVFLSEIESEVVAAKIASRIQRVIMEPCDLEGCTATVGASIGIALSPRDGASYHDLLRAADTAMYHAKRAGRNRIEFYDPKLDAFTQKYIDEQNELRLALARGELELYFQPLYNTQTGALSSAETLLRWNHPTRGLLLPGDFIPVAERANIIGQLGEWVLGEAIKVIARLAAENTPLKLSVNVSPSQLGHLEFIAMVQATLNYWGAPAALLELEITEEVALREPELIGDRLQRLTKVGVSLAIDDFGTGYSNLANLIKLPFSRLKIDKSLVAGIATHAESRVLVQTIVSMANGLGLHSVAEGVETSDQRDLLAAMGCDVLQGFLFSRAVPEAQLRELLAAEYGHNPVKPAFITAA